MVVGFVIMQKQESSSVSLNHLTQKEDETWNQIGKLLYLPDHWIRNG
jgi:hypothetical protein